MVAMAAPGLMARMVLTNKVNQGETIPPATAMTHQGGVRRGVDGRYTQCQPHLTRPRHMCRHPHPWKRCH